ncbi:very-long-chain ceramide synthase [Microdochium nivale]|nr:very-long-chain ceramide synthase [Microdochium nivale]
MAFTKQTLVQNLEMTQYPAQPRKPTSDSSVQVHFVADSKDRAKQQHARCSRTSSTTTYGRLIALAKSCTWTLPLAFIIICVAVYSADPSEHNWLHRYIFISYKTNTTTAGDAVTIQYGKGLRDLAFVSFYTLVLTFTREFVMQELLRPLARLAGLRERDGRRFARFMEQTYTAVYFSIMAPFGLYVLRHHAGAGAGLWHFDTRAMYAGYPHTTHDGLFKAYYLVQAAYWAQQAAVLVLGMEAPRSDSRELTAHHVVTLALIGLSWRFHFGYMGIVVYVTHDVSDLFLAIAKSLQYINSPLAVPQFTLFIGVWVYTRHYLNLRILWSLLTDFRNVGSYQLDWAGQQYKCPLSSAIAFALLSALQALNVFWLLCILRSAYRIVVFKVAKDDRSESEEDDSRDGEEKDE